MYLIDGCGNSLFELLFWNGFCQKATDFTLSPLFGYVRCKICLGGYLTFTSKQFWECKKQRLVNLFPEKPEVVGGIRISVVFPMLMCFDVPKAYSRRHRGSWSTLMIDACSAGSYRHAAILA